MRYVHTNIISKDWRKLADFYIKVFNCEIVPPIRSQTGEWLARGTGVSNAQLEGAHLRLPGYGKNGPTLEIYQYSQIEESPQSVSNQQGYGHIAFEVENVEEVVAHILKEGGQKYGEIIVKKIKGIGVITFTYIKDPDGNIIELQSWDKSKD